MGSVTGLFCPELQKLFNTQELLDNGMDNSMNQLQVNDLFEGAIINSPNREKDHEDSMILVLHKNQETQADFWRIESDPNTQYGVLYTLLFTLAIQIRVVRLQVYADFAVVQFEDQSINFIERP